MYLLESSKTLYIESPNYVQLAIAKFCLSIKDCQSQAFFNDFTIKGLGLKFCLKDHNFYIVMRNPVLPFGSKIPIDSDK